MSVGERPRAHRQRVAAEAASAPLRIGDWLVHRRLVTRHQLLLALKRAYRRRCRLGDAVVELDFLDRDRIEAEVLAMSSFNNLLSAPEQISVC